MLQRTAISIARNLGYENVAKLQKFSQGIKSGENGVYKVNLDLSNVDNEKLASDLSKDFNFVISSLGAQLDKNIKLLRKISPIMFEKLQRTLDVAVERGKRGFFNIKLASKAKDGQKTISKANYIIEGTPSRTIIDIKAKTPISSDVIKGEIRPKKITNKELMYIIADSDYKVNKNGIGRFLSRINGTEGIKTLEIKSKAPKEIFDAGTEYSIPGTTFDEVRNGLKILKEHNLI